MLEGLRIHKKPVCVCMGGGYVHVCAYVCVHECVCVPVQAVERPGGTHS